MRLSKCLSLFVTAYMLARPAAAQPAPAVVALPSNPLTFVGIQPCRMADTRAASGFPSGYGPPALGAAVPRNFALTGRCGIPTSALAVSANVTVVGPAIPGFLGIAPQEGPAATVATLNYVTGQTVGNAAVIPLGTNGGARFTSVAATDLVIDVNGYYTERSPGPASAAMNPLQVATLHWYQAQAGANFPVGGRPIAAAFDGASIWVASQHAGEGSSDTVTKLRASDGAVLGIFVVNGGPMGLAFDGLSVWVATAAGVTRLRASDGNVLGTFAVGGAAVALTFDGASIWVVTGAGLTKLRASDGTVVGTFATGRGPAGIAFDGANIWVSNFNNDNVTKLRANDGSVLGTFSVAGPAGLAFDGASIWVSNFNSAKVTKLRASDGAVLGAFATGTSPSAVAFDGDSVWVVNTGSSNVTKLRASDGALLGTFAVGPNPSGVAFDGANIWVTSLDGNYVTKL